MTGGPRARDAATAVVREWLAESDLDVEESPPGTFAVVLPGERKLRTTVSIVVGAHSVSVNAFVIRRPDEGAAEIHAWLLERNARLYGVAYSIDRYGDVYLTGRMGLHAVTGDELDRWLGAIHENADGAFNLLLSMGFATAIRREWEWRVSRGESTANLEAFRHLAERSPEAAADPGQSDPGQSDPGQADPGQADPRQSDPRQSDPGQADPGQVDPGQADPGQSTPGHTDPNAG